MDVHFTDKQNLDRIVCALKKLSRQHSLTILAISSFNRENYNLEVSMNAFKDPRELELKILKNRSAALGQPIPFRCDPAFSYFEEG